MGLLRAEDGSERLLRQRNISVPDAGACWARSRSARVALIYQAVEVGSLDPDTPADMDSGQRARIDPVPDRLLIQAEDLCDLGHGQELNRHGDGDSAGFILKQT
jgi:hypothetical protein